MIYESFSCSINDINLWSIAQLITSPFTKSKSRTCIERFSFECRKVIGFAFTMLRDWFKNLAPLFHPIRSKTKTNRDSLVRVFRHFASATCNYFVFWLVHLIICVLCDWLEWLPWFWFYDTQMKTALFKIGNDCLDGLPNDDLNVSKVQSWWHEKEERHENMAHFRFCSHKVKHHRFCANQHLISPHKFRSLLDRHVMRIKNFIN